MIINIFQIVLCFDGTKKAYDQLNDDHIDSFPSIYVTFDYKNKYDKPLIVKFVLGYSIHMM